MKKEYTIFEGNVTKLEEMIKKINKRAIKCKQPEITYTIDKEYFEDLNKDNEMESKIVKLLDITINAEPIKIDGYGILASINHTYENGNIVKTLSSEEIPEKYYTIESLCDHCNTKRKRKETVLLQDEEGKIIQVGKSCLKDFLGYDINDKLKYMDLLNEIEKSEVFGTDNIDSSKFIKYFHTEQILNISNLLIKKYGYIKTQNEFGDYNANSTKNMAMIIHEGNGIEYWKDEEKEIFETVATENYKDENVLNALRWIKAQEVTMGYMKNLQVLASNDFINHREAGILCSLMACYYNAVEKEQKAKEKESVQQINNEYVGNVGDKIEIELLYKKVIVYETQYGFMKIHLFADAEGHEYKWNSKNSLEEEEGDTVTLRGTIKAHEEYNGNMQTVLTRCKVK